MVRNRRGGQLPSERAPQSVFGQRPPAPADKRRKPFRLLVSLYGNNGDVAHARHPRQGGFDFREVDPLAPQLELAVFSSEIFQEFFGIVATKVAGMKPTV